MSDFDQAETDAGERRPLLRLVWSNPCPPPPRPIRLDQAVEHHLQGRDGLSDEAFIRMYAGRRRP